MSKLDDEIEKLEQRLEALYRRRGGVEAKKRCKMVTMDGVRFFCRNAWAERFTVNAAVLADE